MTDEQIEGEALARPLLWAVLFVGAMGAAAAASIFDVVDNRTSFFMMLLSLGLLVPMTRAARRREEQKGCMSPALRQYNAWALICGALYTVTFLLATYVHDSIPERSAAMWAIALVPVLPLLGMIWAMRRYLAEESDEYLRHRAISAALFGLGLVLVLGTVWGFLETFGLVPHVWAWWVFPVWAIGLGLAQCWGGTRGA